MARIEFHNIDGTVETLPRRNSTQRQYNTGDANRDELHRLNDELMILAGEIGKCRNLQELDVVNQKIKVVLTKKEVVSASIFNNIVNLSKRGLFFIYFNTKLIPY